MGKNTPERQEYIIRNLRFEHDIVEEEEKENDLKEVAVTQEEEKSKLPN